MSLNANALLRNGLEQLQLLSIPELEDALNIYLDLLDKWNRVYNLTAVRSREERVIKHLLDSLVVAPWLRPGALLDVGSGAGLPGIPLALLDRSRPITLLDSNHKKTRFLQQVKTELGLDQVEVVCDRVEAFSVASPFSQVICRAFTSISEFVTATRHLVSPHGQWLAMKGALPESELEQIRTVEIQADSVLLSVPFLDAERHLVILERRPETTDSV